MGIICFLPKGSCQRCKHFKLDEERNRMACFATQNVTKLEPKICNYLVTVTREDGTVIGSMEIDPDDVCWAGEEFASVIQTAASATEEE